MLIRNRKHDLSATTAESKTASADSTLSSIITTNKRLTICDSGIILPMAFSGFLETRDIAMLKRLNKAASLNFGITALQATVGSHIKDLSSQISLTEKKIHEIISKLSGHVPSKLAMQDCMKNLTVHHLN